MAQQQQHVLHLPADAVIFEQGRMATTAARVHMYYQNMGGWLVRPWDSAHVTHLHRQRAVAALTAAGQPLIPALQVGRFHY